MTSKSGTKGAVAIFIALVLVLTLYIRANNGGIIGKILGLIESPWYTVSVGANNVGEVVFESRSELVRQNSELQARIRDVALEAAKWQESESNFQSATELLGYISDTKLITIPAKVLVRLNADGHEMLLLDKGSKNGIAKGQTVFEGRGLFIGTVFEVGATTTRAMLITDPSMKFGISTLASKSTIGVAKGGYGSFVVADYILRSEEIKIDDVVVTSGSDYGIPSGLVVGIVSSIDDNPEKPYIRAYIEPISDLSVIRFVGILSL